MDLLVQPDDGIASLTTAIKHATTSIDIVIFRADMKELQKALEDAVARGVAVHALIAHTNKGGEKRLRKLEQALLKAGVIVSRTGEDLVRYHGKMMIIDKHALYVLGFNYTYLDVFKSRSFRSRHGKQIGRPGRAEGVRSRRVAATVCPDRRCAGREPGKLEGETRRLAQRGAEGAAHL